MYALDQHQLGSLLYGGALHSIATGRGAVSRGDAPGKGNGIAKAIRILQEGLGISLGGAGGGELANDLGALYDYCVRRLTLANARNDDAMLQEVMLLIRPV